MRCVNLQGTKFLFVVIIFNYIEYQHNSCKSSSEGTNETELLDFQ